MKPCTKTPGCIGPDRHTGDCAKLADAPRLFAKEAIAIAKAYARRVRARRSVQS